MSLIRPADQEALLKALKGQPSEVISMTEARLGWMYGQPNSDDERKRNGARSKQMPPPGDWEVWLILAGRGFGKTRTGAEECWWRAAKNPGWRIAVVAPTKGDLTRTIFEGESGFIGVVPQNVLFGGTWEKAYNKTEYKLTFWNGSVIQGFSSENPERLRGPNHHFAWVDELGAFTLSTMQDTWDMLQFTMRLGKNPQIMITTTPKPYPLIVEIMNSPGTALTQGSTFENEKNLSPKFLKRMVEMYDGTTIGRQELYAEVIDLSEHGIYKKNMFRLWPAGNPFPVFEFVIQSYDTAYTEKTAMSAKKEEADPSAYSCWGVFWNDKTKRREIMFIECWEEYLAFNELREKAIEQHKNRYGADIEDEFSSLPYSRRQPLITTRESLKRTNVNGKGVDAVVVEAIGGGIYLCQELNRSGVPVFEYKPRSIAMDGKGRADKVSRAHLVSHIAAKGMVWIPESNMKPGHVMKWAEGWLTQITAFPFVKHDDLTDTTTQAWKFILDAGFLTFGDEAYANENDHHDDYYDDEEPVHRNASNPYGV